MDVVSLSSGHFGANTYLLVSGSHAAIVDAGCPASVVLQALTERGLTAEYLLLTHGHFDHILFASDLRDRLRIPLYVEEADAELLTDGEKNASRPFLGRDITTAPADRYLTDGARLSLGEETLSVLHTPGHTRGSSCFACGSVLVTGDTLFAGAVGRADLYGGDAATLQSSLARLRARPEPDKITIYPGHDAICSLAQALSGLTSLS